MPEVYLAAVLVLGLQYCIFNPHRLGKQSRVYSDVAVVDFVIMTCLLLPLPPTSKPSPTNVVVSLLRTYYGSVNKQGSPPHIQT
ncbi:RING1 and YY1 binding protein (predicted) [Rattus norvegicus]|uniref:RING1 and YY1 binding protein (Predicted) n=1 Tax=Rattus norvegicus TaxID=10116 RepID=A6IBH6_RAT|nr:RING1 and YY1 binding protein (predicted) [Rattus norvegicus]|eukprot:NP_001101349.1 RING1 and YY1-binding protein [Rattus norvegicus]